MNPCHFYLWMRKGRDESRDGREQAKKGQITQRFKTKAAVSASLREKRKEKTEKRGREFSYASSPSRALGSSGLRSPSPARGERLRGDRSRDRSRGDRSRSRSRSRPLRSPRAPETSTRILLPSSSVSLSLVTASSASRGSSYSTNAKPGGLLATHTFFSLPTGRNASSNCSFVVLGSRLPTYTLPGTAALLPRSRSRSFPLNRSRSRSRSRDRDRECERDRERSL